MSSGALRAAWEAAQGTPSGLRAAWERAQQPPTAGHDYHAEYNSGALAKRMEGANARDAANAAEEDASAPVGTMAAFGHALGATAANLGEGIPGFEAAQAGVRSVASHVPNMSMQAGMPIVTPGPGAQSYSEALGDIRHETDKIPKGLKTVERIAGALPLIKVLPASPVAGGAALGALDQALAADPDISPMARTARTATGAVGGALAGKVGETLVTGARTLVSSSAATNVLKRLAAQALSARKIYGLALQQGQGKVPTEQVLKFVEQPDIAEIVGELQRTRPFQGVPAHAPEMLDAIYKTLSDRAAVAKKGLEALSPNRPNIGRFRLKDTKAAQSDLLDAMSGPKEQAPFEFERALREHSPPPPPGFSIPATPPPMPAYRTAVNDFAQHARGVEGVKRGYDAIRTATSNTLPRSANLTRTTPEALEEWARAADDAAKSAAGEGTIGGAKAAWRGLLGGKMGRAALSRAPKVLRDIGDPTQQQTDRWLTALLLSGSAATP